MGDAAMAFERICFKWAPTPAAESAAEVLIARYGDMSVEEADVIVALGGDGFMLQMLHQYLYRDIPIYGMNKGTIGFLMNTFQEVDLLERINGATLAEIHPLRMIAEPESGGAQEALAINEVSLLRQTRQAAKVRIEIDGRVRMEELICDGLLLSTPAGSTACVTGGLVSSSTARPSPRWPSSAQPSVSTRPSRVRARV